MSARLTKTNQDGSFSMADGLCYGKNSRAYKRALIRELGIREEKEESGNVAASLTANHMIFGYRIGDLIAVKNMVDEMGEQSIKEVADQIRYGYKLAVADMKKAIDKKNEDESKGEDVANDTDQV